ncbi:MAG: hypothetical protein HC904_07185 [Blastochloris sp.]|nr:hypothetical protein [Blastochloris sp.]
MKRWGRHSGMAVLVLLVWAGLKVPWELRLARERSEIMYGAELPPMSMELRDSLGQGMTLAALGGFRGVAANFLWLSVTTAWEEQQWTRLRALAEMVVLLSAEGVFFWENAGWHMAYNASVSAERFSGDAERGEGPRMRNVESMHWIKQGIELYERGIRAIPEKPKLYEMLALLYQQRLQDHEKAAHYFELASQKEGAPVYLERFAGFALEKAGEREKAYAHWVKLWQSSEEHGPGPRRWGMIEERIRKLEKN